MIKLLNFGALGLAQDLEYAGRIGDCARGNLLILCNALSYSLFLVLAREITGRYPARTVMAWTFVFGALGVSTLGVPALVHTRFAAIDTRTWLVIAYIVVGGTLGAYFLNTWALARASASTVAIYIYWQPVLTALLAWATLGERPPLRTYIAAALIFAGIYVATAAAGPRRSAAHPR